jgi:hypothetical protein
MGMAVMSISSPEDGRPNDGLFDCEIHHLVQAASREDIVVGENLADWRAMVDFYTMTLMKASLSNDC